MMPTWRRTYFLCKPRSGSGDKAGLQPSRHEAPRYNKTATGHFSLPHADLAQEFTGHSCEYSDGGLASRRAEVVLHICL